MRPRLAEALADVLGDFGWYADLHTGDESFVVYADHVFRYPKGDAAGRAEAQSPTGAAHGVPVAAARLALKVSDRADLAGGDVVHQRVDPEGVRHGRQPRIRRTPSASAASAAASEPWPAQSVWPIRSRGGCRARRARRAASAARRR